MTPELIDTVLSLADVPRDGPLRVLVIEGGSTWAERIKARWGGSTERHHYHPSLPATGYHYTSTGSWQRFRCQGNRYSNGAFPLILGAPHPGRLVSYFAKCMRLLNDIDGQLLLILPAASLLTRKLHRQLWLPRPPRRIIIPSTATDGRRDAPIVIADWAAGAPPSPPTIDWI